MAAYRSWMYLYKVMGSLGHSVYMKKTHTDRHLLAESHHRLTQKAAVLNTLANQTFHISGNTYFNKKKSHLIRT